MKGQQKYDAAIEALLEGTRTDDGGFDIPAMNVRLIAFWANEYETLPRWAWWRRSRAAANCREAYRLYIESAAARWDPTDPSGDGP